MLIAVHLSLFVISAYTLLSFDRPQGINSVVLLLLPLFRQIALRIADWFHRSKSIHLREIAINGAFLDGMVEQAAR